LVPGTSLEATSTAPPTVREVWLALLLEFRIEPLPASLQFGRPVLELNRMFLERDWVGTLRRHTARAGGLLSGGKSLLADFDEIQVLMVHGTL
jgi:hypothetical protein